MGAPLQHARKPGTGQIRRAKEKWYAYAPKMPGCAKERRIGLYRTRREAEKALAEWLRADAGKTVAIVSPSAVVSIGADARCEVGAFSGGYAQATRRTG